MPPIERYVMFDVLWMSMPLRTHWTRRISTQIVVRCSVSDEMLMCLVIQARHSAKHSILSKSSGFFSSPSSNQRITSSKNVLMSGMSIAKNFQKEKER